MSPVPDSSDDGFGGALLPGARPAVLVIDLMRAYFDPASPLCLPSADCLQSAGRVIAAARDHRVPVLHTRVAYGPGGVDGGLFVRKVTALQQLFSGGGAMGELMPQVSPAEDELVLVKQYASAFFGTSLASTLRAERIDTVVLVGVSTSGCVRATAVDAIQHGLVPLVVSEAVADRAPGPHEASLYDLQAKYAEVISEARAVGYLSEER
ncbi:isochorismatase family protein [Micromonospora zamorensis]|uniref:isochorismatase family protein n=1 Tax=Micromonospora zamorensis TaxID=709883 RepID=UPI0033DBAA68